MRSGSLTESAGCTTDDSEDSGMRGNTNGMPLGQGGMGLEMFGMPTCTPSADKASSERSERVRETKRAVLCVVLYTPSACLFLVGDHLYETWPVHVRENPAHVWGHRRHQEQTQYIL